MKATIDIRNPAVHTSQQWKLIAMGVGAAVGGLVAMTISQLAAAPTARADDFTDIIDNVQFVISQGHGQLGIAAADFSNSDLAHALSQVIAGVDNISVAPQEDVLVGTIDALMGHTPFETLFGFSRRASTWPAPLPTRKGRLRRVRASSTTLWPTLAAPISSTV